MRRLPKAGGEASYVHTAYNRLWLTRLTAGGVALSGVVSAATLATAFAGYFQAVAPVPAWIVMSVVVATAVALAAMGCFTFDRRRGRRHRHRGWIAGADCFGGLRRDRGLAVIGGVNAYAAGIGVVARGLRRPGVFCVCGI